MSQEDKIKKLEKLLSDQHESNAALRKKIRALEKDNKLLREVLDKLNKPSQGHRVSHEMRGDKHDL